MRKHELHPHTALLNQKERNKCKLARLNALQWLRNAFPEAFCNETRIRPLKIGVLQDILQHAKEAQTNGISKSKLREAVVVFTRRIDYLTCLKAQEMRVDLNGNPTTAVTVDEAEKAASKIRKRVEKSARNARKNLIGKTNAPYVSKPQGLSFSQSETSNDTNLARSGYPERPPAYSAHKNPISTQNAASVVIKHKSSKPFDPDAVARLKAKLGLNINKKILSEEGSQ